MRQEDKLSQDVSNFLQLKYPKVIFRFDFASGLKMSMNQAVKHKKLQGDRRGYPDLTIYESNEKYNGLMIELKATSPFLKDGKTLKKNQHLKEQDDYLNKLREEGYYATFSTGLGETIEIIDRYLLQKVTI